MPKGFLKLERHGGGAPFYIAIDMIARFGQSQPSGTYVVMKTMDGGESDCIIVEPSPEDLAAMIEAAQGERPRRSEFAEAMGSATGAFGGAR